MGTLLPKGGINWKAAQARLPPGRVVYNTVFRTRFLLYVAISAFIIVMWREFRGTAGDMQRYVIHDLMALAHCVENDSVWVVSGNVYSGDITNSQD